MVAKGDSIERFLTPDGAGDRSGSDWANAAAATGGGLQQVWDEMGPGSTLYLGSGTYPQVSLTIQAGGQDLSNTMTIQGIDTGEGLPLLTSQFDKTRAAKTGAVVIRGMPNTGYWAVRDLRMQDVKHGVVLMGRNVGVRINNIEISRCREGVTIHGGLTAEQTEGGTRDVIVTDSRFGPYTKRGIRFRDGVSDVRIINCHADAGGEEWATERFHIGFSVQGSKMKGVFDHDIVFIGCSAKNNYDDQGDQYWNADGFTAERQTYNITYIDCEATHNTDGGWDIKTRNPVLVSCMAKGNKRNYRFWTKPGPAMMIGCVGGDAVHPGGSGTSAGIHVTQGAQVLAIDCEFANNPINLDVDSQNPQSPGSSLELRRGRVLSPGKSQFTLEKGGTVRFIGVEIQPTIDPSEGVEVSP